jgi:Lipase (class 3)
MKQIFFFSSIFFLVLFTACNGKKKSKDEVPAFLSAKEAVQLNQLIYKDSSRDAFAKYSPTYEVVFVPKPVNGNYAIIAKNKTSNQYALVIRGSVIEFSNEGFQNFILQDFNIFKIKPWNYTDSVKEAYVSNGAWIGFQNLLLLRDIQTGLNMKEFIEQQIEPKSSIIITGHSLGGNLAYPLAGYLKKELPAGKKENLQLITFGAPAAGNAAFVKDMEDKFPTAERYTTDMDIASIFPDIEGIQQMSKLIGLDTVLHLGTLTNSVIGKELNAGRLLDLAGEILERTNVINESNKYVQSQKHLRQLTNVYIDSSNSVLSVEAIFDKAYRYHKVDRYAELLGGEAIKEN